MENKPNKKRDIEVTIFALLAVISFLAFCLLFVDFVHEHWGYKPLYALLALLFSIIFFMISVKTFDDNGNKD
jgi:predicted tellurium resistance membrane protein TerC